MYNFDSYNVLLSIATNILVLLMTAFVLQRHIFKSRLFLVTFLSLKLDIGNNDDDSYFILSS